MDRKRKVYAPFSQTSEAGVAQTPVEGYIGVNQTIYPSVDTGVIDENGIWKGVKSDDNEFRILGTDEQVANGGEVLAPGGNEPFIDMTGFADLFIALKVSNGGNYAFEAVMGPDTEAFANLSPVNPAAALLGAYTNVIHPNDFETLFSDTAQSITADVWEIFIIQGLLRSQKHMQFKITNNSGGASDMQFAYMRLV